MPVFGRIAVSMARVQQSEVLIGREPIEGFPTHTFVAFQLLRTKEPKLEDRDLEFSVVSGPNEEMLFRCLESLHKTLRTSRYSWSVTVTCNEAGTGLPGRVRAHYPDATLIQNEKSIGIAASHNRVIKSSHARYVWLLSDDVLILPSTIQRVTEFMDRPGSARVGVVSPRLLNPDGSLQPSTNRFPAMSEILFTHSGLRKLSGLSARSGSTSPESRSNESASPVNARDQVVDVDTLRGVCAAVRMKAIRQVGPMAEVAFAGGEETEWHHRFRDSSWRVVYFPEATVIYYGSQTARESSNFYPDHLRGDLYFLRTTRSPVTFGAFSAVLLGILGVRTLYAWARRDKFAATAARRNAQVVWRGLHRNSQYSQLQPS